jgi:hypothetical protein
MPTRRIFIMITTFVATRRWLVALLVAVMVATAAYGPVLLDEVAGLSVSTPVYACQGPPGGC